MVDFDGRSIARVKIPGVYSNQVEGICADFNGHPGNDLITRGGVDVSGEAKQYALFGDSWQVEDPTNPL